MTITPSQGQVHKPIKNAHLTISESKHDRQILQKIFLKKANYYDSLAQQIKLDNELKIQDSIESIVSQFDDISARSTEAIIEIQRLFESHMQAMPAHYDEYKMISAMYKYYQRTRLSLGFLPIRNRYDAKVHEMQSELNGSHRFFNQAKVAINPADLNYALYSEVFADYFSIVKFSIGTSITPQQENEEDTSFIESQLLKRNNHIIGRVSNGGGNVVFKAEYPIVAWANTTGQYRFNAVVSNKLAFDVPFNHAEFKKYPIHFEPALQSTLSVKGQNEMISIVSSYKISLITGNEHFYSAMQKPDNTHFMLYQWTIGLTIKEKFQLNFNLFQGSNYVKQFFNNTVSFGYIFE